MFGGVDHSARPQIASTSHGGVERSVGDDATHQDVEVDETPALELGDSHIPELPAHDPTELLHRHRQQSTRCGVELCRKVVPVGLVVNRRADGSVAFGVVVAAPAPLNELAALPTVPDCPLVDGSEHIRTWCSQRQEGERDLPIVIGPQPRTDDLDCIPSIDLGAVGAAAGEAGAAVLLEHTGADLSRVDINRCPQQ